MKKLKSSKLFVLIPLLVTIFILSMATETVAKSFKIKLGHVSPLLKEEHYFALGFKKYTEDNSEIKVEIYPNSQLGGHRELVEQTMNGIIQMSMTTAGGFAQIFPAIQVLDLPYLIADRFTAEEFQKGKFFDELNEALVPEAGIRIISTVNWTNPRCFLNTKRVVKEPKDLQGLKIRTINSPLAMKLTEAMGAKPTPVDWAELYMALKTGIVEGTKNSVNDAVTKKFYETGLLYATLDLHSPAPVFVFINEKFYKSLSEEQRIIIREAARFGVIEASSLEQVFNRENAKIFLEKGGTIYQPSPEEKAKFREKSEGAWRWFIDKYGDYWVKRAIYHVNVANSKLGDLNRRPLVKMPE